MNLIHLDKPNIENTLYEIIQTTEVRWMCAIHDFSVFPQVGSHTRYVTYDVMKDQCSPFPVDMDIAYGTQKIIQSGIAENPLFHAILKENTATFDVIAIHLLDPGTHSCIEIIEFSIQKTNDYQSFLDFSNSYIWIEPLSPFYCLIRVCAGSKNEAYEHHIFHLKSRCMYSLPEQYAHMVPGKVGALSGEGDASFVVKMGDPASVEDRRWIKTCQPDIAYPPDQIILLQITTDENNLEVLNEETLIMTRNDDCITEMWVSGQHIHYFLENASNDLRQYCVYDVATKQVQNMAFLSAGSGPYITPQGVFFIETTDDALIITHPAGDVYCTLKRTAFTEEPNRFCGPHLIVSSALDFQKKKLYRIPSGEWICDFTGDQIGLSQDGETIVLIK